jgi:hypothetical protein
LGRYRPKQNGGNSTALSTLGKSREYNFKPGRAKTGGRVKGTPNKIPGELLRAIVDACASVGYDRDVYTRKKKNGTWLIEADESKRIKGLEPYLRRTAELHRKEMAAILGKIVTPAVVQLMINNNSGTDVVELKEPTVQELEHEISRLGININIFHGDEGRKPKPIIIDQ